MGYRRDSAAMVVYREEPVVIGGGGPSWSSNSAEIFKAAEGDWKETEKIPTPSLSFHSALVVNDRIYTFGGFDSEIG